MPYQSGGRLPGESASKLGHLPVVSSPWVKNLVESFEEAGVPDKDTSGTVWIEFDTINVKPLSKVWAVDGSFVPVRSEGQGRREVAFVKSAILTVDRMKIAAIDQDMPHPLLLKNILRDSAIFHATVFPLKNVKTLLGNNYDAIRHIVYDSIRLDQDGYFFETLKWLAYKKWSSNPTPSPSFQCPHCRNTKEIPGLPLDSDSGLCPYCDKEVFITDMIGFHQEMDEDSAPESIASAYMLVMEHLMILSAVRFNWEDTDKSLVSDTLYIKDGPLTLRGQYSKLVPPIREFLEFAKKQGRPVHIIGQEKTGSFYDHLSSIARYAPPRQRGDALSFAPLSHEYVHKEVYRTPNAANPYGLKTNWGEKVYVKTDPGHFMVLSITTGAYNEEPTFPKANNLIGLDRILATIPSLVSHKFEGALYPIELANGIASMSSYPSAKILQRMIDIR
jgi:hypothetical protein